MERSLEEADAEDGVGGPPDSGVESTDDTQSLITAFRKKREMRRTRATRAIVFLAFAVGFVGLQWADITLHAPDLLPFIPKEDQWSVGYFLNNVGMALAYIAADELDFEKLWGELPIGGLRDDPPSTALALGTKLAYFYLCAGQTPTLFKKYGWFVTHTYFTTWLFPLVSLCLALVRGELSVFAPRVTHEMPFIKRKPTVCEWYSVHASLNFLVYVGVDAEMWSRNQWQGNAVPPSDEGSAGSDGLLGPSLSPIVAILVTLFCGTRYVHKWALRSFEQHPPGWFTDARCTLFGSLWMQFNLHLGVALVARAMLQPDNQILMGDDHTLLEKIGVVEPQEAPTRRINNGEAMFLVGAIFIVVPGVAFRYRSQIYDYLAKSFNAKQRLLDGAFIAALLEYNDEDDRDCDSADRSGFRNASDLIADTATLIRRVPMRHVSLAMLSASPRDPAYDAAKSFDLGESCGLGGVDYFVSHSWSDCPKQKFAQICAVALRFYQRHGREPTLWLDKCCIDQTDIARTLRCLPVMVQSCHHLLILCGDSYCQRLWCVWELYTWFAMSGQDAAKRTTIVNAKRSAHDAMRLEQLKQRLQDEAASTKGGAATVSDAEVLAAEAASALQQELTVHADRDADFAASGAGSEVVETQVDGHNEWKGVSELLYFDVQNAHCFSAEDEAKLRRVIESESAETFNTAIREAGKALLDAAIVDDAKNNAGGQGRHSVGNPLAGAAPGTPLKVQEKVSDEALRLDFAALDYNKDGRLCRNDLLRAFGSSDGSADGSKTWFGESQVDELLSCIATVRPRILVNGSISIGLAEFQSWMKRST